MVSEPVPYVRAAARALREAGATLVAGHSAHVFHGAGDAVLYDLGDFVDDYSVDPRLRNDRGLLFFVEVDRGGARRLEALPLALEYAHTRLARRQEAAWVRERFRAACAALGTKAREEEGRLVVDWT
jgi:poly-gamma-glutamate capsule biosynthesis protein CapA/YwtB (metallophosphatase superfamily)